MAGQLVAVKPSADGAFRFPSKSGGAGHEVRVVTAKDGSRYPTCQCVGGRHAWQGTKFNGGCWAMKAVSAELGL